MRMFDLYLRRAGLSAAAGRSRHRCIQRLTLACESVELANLRRQLTLDLRDAGLEISALRVTPGLVDGSVNASLEVDCPPERHAAMMRQLRRLRTQPGVHWLDVDTDQPRAA